MEALTKYDFKAVQNDELSFNRNDVLKILVVSCVITNDWCKAELNGNVGYVPYNYIELKPHPWFEGEMSRQEAAHKLLKKLENGNYKYPDGSFLVRCSETEMGDFSIDVKFGGHVKNFDVMRTAGGHYFVVADMSFYSVNKLVEYYRYHSIDTDDPRVILKDMKTEL